MCALIGNKNAVGNRGGRRPSPKEEIWHLEKWQRDTAIDELEKKIASKVYAIRDVWLLKALKGDGVILKQAADKILADLHKHTGEGTNGEILVKWLK